MWAVDVNERAVALCADNAAAAGPAQRPRPRRRRRRRPRSAAGLRRRRRFAAIYSNPPIRIGKAALHELLAGWLARLAPDGVAHLVVQKHLGSDSLARVADRGRLAHHPARCPGPATAILTGRAGDRPGRT